MKYEVEVDYQGSVKYLIDADNPDEAEAKADALYANERSFRKTVGVEVERVLSTIAIPH